MRFRRAQNCLRWLALAAAPVIPAQAQSALYRLDGETAYKLVHKMDGRASYIVNPSPNDSGMGNVAPRYRLQAVEEFFPAFVTVNVLQANFSRAGLNSVHRLDQTFSFTVKFSSDYNLADTFFVVAFDLKSPVGRYYAQEITPNELRLGKAISIETSLPSDEAVGKYELHVFSRGVEVFNSTLPRETIEKSLGRMVAKKLKGVRQAEPKPLTGPLPRYPDDLPPAAGKGQATIRCVIAATGKPQNVQVKSASAPAFGQAALRAMTEWWFVPKVVDGKPIDSAADLPFEFVPPAAKTKS